MTTGFRLKGVLPGYQPVFCSPEHLYLFRRGHLYRSDHGAGTPARIAEIPTDRPLVSRGPRLLQRIFRTAIQSAASCGSDTLLLARRSRIWRLDLDTGAVVLDHVVPEGRSLLSLNRVTAAGVDWLVYGEYLHNPSRAEVRLWRRRCERDACWEVAATFPAGEIDHVHAVHQLNDGRIFVLTGDFDEAAGIWEIDADFRELSPFMRGEQRFRACWWFEHRGQIVYGTDSQFERNKLLKLHVAERTIETVRDLPGSCIYQGRTGDDLVFSTTVEPGASSGSRVRDMLSRAAGPGITGNPTIFVHSEHPSELFSAPKDAWPLRLGQFGTFMFPAGAAPTNRIYAYGVAVKGYDGACLVFEKP